MATFSDPKLQMWIDNLRADLDKLAPLKCPTCAKDISRQALESGVCPNCQSPFINKSVARFAARWFGGVLTVAIIIGLVILLINELPELFPQLLSGFRGHRILLYFVVLACIGSLPILFKDVRLQLSVFSPLSNKPERTLKILAKKFEKQEDFVNAARFYAELLTHGFNFNAYVMTPDAYDFFQRRDLSTIEVPFYDEFRDLLFFERLQACSFWANYHPDYTELRKKADLAVLALAGSRPRLLALAEIIGTPELKAMVSSKSPSVDAVAQASIATITARKLAQTRYQQRVEEANSRGDPAPSPPQFIDHEYNSNGFCVNCGWCMDFIEQSHRPCLSLQADEGPDHRV